jgi:hypothetical protein
MPWTNAFLPGGFQAPTAAAMEITAIPRLVLVDPEGTILAVDGDLRGETLRETVAGFIGR